MVLAGSSKGVWNGINYGGQDFAAVKIDSDGTEIWRWQVKWPGFIHPGDFGSMFQLNHTASYTHMEIVQPKYVPRIMDIIPRIQLYPPFKVALCMAPFRVPWR